MLKNKSIWLGTALIITIIAIITGVYLKPYWNALKPVIGDSGNDTSTFIQNLKNQDNENDVDNGPFIVHPDFRLSIYSDAIINPRVMIEDESGAILVSEPSQSRVSLLNEKGEQEVLVDNLNRPHGLAIKDAKLYIAETGQVIEYDYKNQKATNPRTILDLPADGRHWTRTIAFAPDTDELYISVGSSCNICIEDDERRTTILRYTLSTQELVTYATGLRNAVFFNWNDEGQLFATEMGRDWLGDDLPPDELNLVKEGKDYGFPYCYGKNIIDPEYNQSTECLSAEPSFYDFIAHEAPLGIDFLEGDAIIALHGSWNRKEPSGYEVIRLTSESDFQVRESLLSGFLLEDGNSIGRPAGILVLSDESILISDDKEDIIYRLQKR